MHDSIERTGSLDRVELRLHACSVSRHWIAIESISECRSERGGHVKSGEHANREPVPTENMIGRILDAPLIADRRHRPLVGGHGDETLFEEVPGSTKQRQRFHHFDSTSRVASPGLMTNPLTCQAVRRHTPREEGRRCLRRDRVVREVDLARMGESITG